MDGTVWVHRHPCLNGGASRELRMDRQLSSDELYSLSHADEPKPDTLRCVSGVKALSGIAHDEPDRACCLEQLHLGSLCPAVLGRIVKSFLQHAEER